MYTTEYDASIISFAMQLVKNVLPTPDDCSYYVFTNSKGPIIVKNDKLSFLAEEKVNKQQAEEFLSEAASKKIKEIIKIK